MSAIDSNKVDTLLKAYTHLRSIWTDGKGGLLPNVHIEGAVASGSQVLAASIVANPELKHSFHLFVAEDKERMLRIENDLSKLLPTHTIYSFPLSEAETDNEQVLRNEALLDLYTSQGKGVVWVSWVDAILQKVDSIEEKQKNVLQFKQGDKVNINQLVSQLQNLGFELTEFVYTSGQIAKRGGIVDVFSFGHSLPFRLEMMDDEILTIRTFDPHTQLSEQKLARLDILPSAGKESETPTKKVPLWQNLPPHTCFWLYDWKKVTDNLVSAEESTQEKARKKDEIKAWEKATSQGQLFSFGKTEVLPDARHISLQQTPQPAFNKNFDLLIKELSAYKQRQFDLFLSYTNESQYERIQQILQDLQTDIHIHSIPFSIQGGFVDEENKVLVYTDHEIFNRYYQYKSKRNFKAKEALDLKSIYQLQIGDYVTHIDHGIGVFSGLQQVEVGGKRQEVIRLLYKDNDTLYVNIYSLHKISKYATKDGATPSIHKLGSEAWQKAKDQTKRRVKQIAFDLITLYAERKKVKAYAHQEDNYLQNELEASFIYEETPDQLKAIQDVKHDMQQPIPMDRLVCGDVGFGKTEVAIRAAFKAILDGKQVAVLVPTTILAIQHYHSFRNRMSFFSPRIEFINRFKTAKEKKIIKERLSKGEIDIIIGTQALLAKDVTYKDLSLLIVDEEQKFGVSDKEKLKNIKRNVDCLTLTATPIPRTLQLSLIGARDLSVIQTPPPNRQPPHTEILQFSTEKIKEIIAYEVARDGQVFFIQNRIEGIMEMTSLLRSLCPQVAFEYSHGQLPGHELEEKMLDFIEGKFDVLVSTNIIESGLDISNANTIIINNAHQFGLSDLHQLRGRVGRNNKKAYCYLVAPPLTNLTQEQRKKLEIIEAFSDLGSGFQVAMKDLDMRGSGNILGGEQSGFMQELGFDTYQRVLAEAIQELKEESLQEELKDVNTNQFYAHDCTFETDLSIFIPSEYISNGNERMSYYKAINDAKNEQDIETLKRKMEDIFGTLPEMIESLFTVVRTRWLASELGFSRLVHKDGELFCYFSSAATDSYFQSSLFSAILDYIQVKTKNIRLKQGTKTIYLSVLKIETIPEALKLFQAIVQHHEDMLSRKRIPQFVDKS